MFSSQILFHAPVTHPEAQPFSICVRHAKPSCHQVFPICNVGNMIMQHILIPIALHILSIYPLDIRRGWGGSTLTVAFDILSLLGEEEGQ